MADSKLFSFLQKASQASDGIKKGIDVAKRFGNAVGNLSKDTDGDGKSQGQNIQEACLALEQKVVGAVKQRLGDITLFAREIMVDVKADVDEIKELARTLLHLLEGVAKEDA